MHKTLILIAALTMISGCKTQKKRLAEQNNAMVSIHKAVHKARLATEVHKKDKVKFEESVQALLEVLKKQTKALEKLSVDAKMIPLKELLQKTFDEMVKGYRSVLAYLEKSKNLEAQGRIAEVERQFVKRTLELRTLSRKIAKENNISIKESQPEPPAPKVAPPALPMDAAPKTATPPVAPKPEAVMQPVAPAMPAAMRPASATPTTPAGMPAPMQ